MYLHSHWLVLLPQPFFFCVHSFFSIGQFSWAGHRPLSHSASQSSNDLPHYDFTVFKSNSPRCTLNQSWATRCLLINSKFIKRVTCPKKVTLNTALSSVLSNTPTNSEVNRMNGCRDMRRTVRQTKIPCFLVTFDKCPMWLQSDLNWAIFGLHSLFTRAIFP